MRSQEATSQKGTLHSEFGVESVAMKKREDEAEIRNNETRGAAHALRGNGSRRRSQGTRCSRGRQKKWRFPFVTSSYTIRLRATRICNLFFCPTPSSL
jgi:hypothetical protein